MTDTKFGSLRKISTECFGIKTFKKLLNAGFTAFITQDFVSNRAVSKPLRNKLTLVVEREFLL